jgi:hypothetical protein
VWIHLPRGFQSSCGPNTCLKLKKSLYGLSIAPKLWYETLSKALLNEGFKQSQNDKCFLYKEGFLIVLYVNDAGLAVKNPNDVDKLLNNLQAKGFEMTRESSFAEFLASNLSRMKKQTLSHLPRKDSSIRSLMQLEWRTAER